MPLRILLTAYSSVVRDFTYMSYPLTYYTAYSKTTIQSAGGYVSGGMNLRCIPPNFFRVTNSYFLMPDMTSKNTSYTLDEQLYTASGSQRIIIGTAYESLLYINDLDTNFVVQFTTPTSQFPIYGYRLLKPLAFLTSAPVFSFSSFPDQTTQDALVSCPTYFRLANGTWNSINDIPIERLFIDVRPDASQSSITRFKNDVSGVICFEC